VKKGGGGEGELMSYLPSPLGKGRLGLSVNDGGERGKKKRTGK